MNPLGKLCNYCKQASERTKICKCEFVRYCSKECQNAEWSKHKKVCKIMTPRKGNKRFENDVVKALTIERDLVLTRYLTKLVGTCIKFEFKQWEFDLYIIEHICVHIVASIMHEYEWTEKLDSLPRAVDCSQLIPKLNNISKIFPKRDADSICILIVYKNNNEEEITKSIQLSANQLRVK